MRGACGECEREGRAVERRQRAMLKDEVEGKRCEGRRPTAKSSEKQADDDI